MSKLTEVIEQVNKANISLWIDDEKLKFRAAKGAMSAELRSAIGSVKKDLIEYLKNVQENESKEKLQQTIFPHQSNESSPLSFSQQRLWIIDQLEKNSASYNIPYALNLKGDLDISALQSSINTLIKRHAALRTKIVVENELPKQKVSSTLGLDLVTEFIVEDQLQTIANSELHTPFDLENDDLIRVRLLKITPQHHVLLLTLHHIISDGWSMGILIRELAALYVSIQTSTPLTLPELPIQFTDYAWWQKQQQENGVLDQKLNYWVDKLDGAPALHDFPTDFPRPPVQAFKGASVKVNISKKQMTDLQNFSRKHGVTMFMTLLTALKTLFWKYSNQQDQVIGAPVANRQYPELEGIIGFFANTLVLRSQLEPNDSFECYLQQVRDVCLSAYANQEVPFERIVEQIQPERSLANNPLFQFMLVLQNQPKDNFHTDSLSFTEVPQEGNISRFDMTFMLSETSEGIVGQIEYDTALFEEATIIRFLARWTILLKEICQLPQNSIKQLTTDKTTVDSEFIYKGKESHVPSHRLIQDTFYQQLSVQPDATAIFYSKQQYSYLQLEQKSNQYANLLINHGVVEGSKVALHLHKCPDLTFLTLAIWKVGACFVPLDPKHPEQRLQQMLDSSQPDVLITNQAFSNLNHANKFQLDVFSKAAKKEDINRPENRVRAEQAAYIMYTSGTTGKPQGIMIPHRTITHLMSWELKQIPGPNKVLQFASIGFDLSILELLLALDSGGSLVIIEDEIRTDTELLSQLIQQHQINVAVIPPTVLHHWAKLDSDKASNYKDLRHIITAGEQLELSSEICAFFDRYPHCKLHNQYGPAETHVVTAHTFQAPSNKWPKYAPIGKPIDNVNLHILDAMGQPQDKSTPGELYISGPAVGLGYLGQNNIQQNRFTMLSGKRCYRTGDKVRINESDEIEFLGRLDRQIKIRGFRIELDEIERQINDLDNITHSVAAVDKNISESPRLITWVVTTDNKVSDEDIRTNLAKKLPSYMIPAVIVTLDKIPLNQNGKPDVKQLFELVDNRSAVKELVSPINEVERKILDIWKPLFPEKAVCVTDDFFAIGGHSLLATQVISRINSEFNSQLTLKQIFEYTTVQSLAKQINSGKTNTLPSAIIKTNRTSDNLPLSFAQQRLWTLQQFDGIGGTYNMPTSLALEGELNYTILNRCFNQIIDRHEILRTRFFNIDGIPVQRIEPKFNFLIKPEVISEDQIEAICSEVAAKPFDLQHDELLRVRLLKLSKNKHVLLVVIHHIISDGWSIGVFVDELSHCYTSLLKGNSVEMSPLPIQYADYAIWQRNWITGPEFNKQVTFWKDALSGLPPLLELPTDRPRPIIQSFNGQSVPIEISKEVLNQMHDFCQEHGVTLYMFLLSTLQMMLWRYSGQSDIAVGAPVANRIRPELENLLGCFLNTIVLRNQISPTQDFLNYLNDVKNTTLNAYSHQDIPFDQVVEHLKIHRNTSHSPLFQVMLVLQNTPKKSLNLGNVEVSSLPFESKVSRFDMTFNLNEGQHGITGNIEYNSDLFDPQTVQCMFNYLLELIQAVLSKPNSTIDDICCVSHTTESDLLNNLKGQENEYRKLETIPQAIANIAEIYPKDAAIRWHDETISYQDLIEQSNIAAQVLMNQGVSPGDLVGIHLDPSAQRVILMLAVTQLGAAYLPLDPSYPEKRLRFMIEDSGLKLLISEVQEHSDLPIKITALSEYKKSPVANRIVPGNKLKPTDPLYLIYTSGSTGCPKPVVVTHQNIMRLADNSCYQSLSKDAITLNHSSFSFDASAYEIWGTLVNGGELVVVDKNDKDPSNLGNIIASHHVNSALFSPLLLNELLMTQAEHLQYLKHIVVGGDVFIPSTARLALKTLPNTIIYNAYGPTENGVISTCHRLSRENEYLDTIPIGRSIDNSFALILDESMRMVPPGAIGELWLGGDGLASGYAHHKNLTASRFIESEKWGSIYKTGDLVKLNHQHGLIYMGRNDHQINLRGFRIELGEIESVLSNLEDVKNVAVLLKGANEHARLVAYISPSNIDITELRKQAVHHLMDFMRPSEYIALEELPLSPNGKIDRNKLNEIKSKPELIIERPSTPTEQLISETWHTVLERQDIRITDNFFDVGGNSLLVMRLRQQLSQKLQIEIPVTTLFQYPSIQTQADYFTTEKQSSSSDNKVENHFKKQNRNANRHRRQRIKRR